MEIQSIYKGQTVKVVTVTGIDNASDTEVTEFAMAAAGETKGSLTGHNVGHYRADNRAVVQLYTD